MSNSGYACSWVGRDVDAGRDTDDVNADSGVGCWVLVLGILAAVGLVLVWKGGLERVVRVRIAIEMKEKLVSSSPIYPLYLEECATQSKASNSTREI